tara:strand:+ start:6195 stop:6959 length:765 start_codon:yes stop_codon:yes gene_type:complete
MSDNTPNKAGNETISEATILDMEELSKYGFDKTFTQTPSVAEEFRAIKRSLLKAVSEGENGQKNNRILVTSLYEKEGKTFTCLNLARSISFELNKNVLLVDVNIMSPKIGDLMMLNDKTKHLGLVDFLSEWHTTVPNVIYSTDIERLKLLPMGSRSKLGHANEYLNSDEMTTLLDEFKGRYNDRIVLFDGPPLVGVNEAYTLSENIDQIIIVIEDGRVKDRDLMEAVRKLPKGVKVHYLLNKGVSEQTWKKHRQ